VPQERFARVRFFDEGVLLPQVEEVSLYDLNSHPVLQFSLGDHVLLRTKIVAPAGILGEVVNLATGFVEGLIRSVTDGGDSETPTIPRAGSGMADNIDWVGEIVKINTDGTVKVRLAREANPPPDWAGERYDLVKGEDLIVIEADDESEGDTEDYDNWFAEEISLDGSDSDDEWEDASEGDLEDELPEASLDGMDEIDTSEPIITNGPPEEMSVVIDSSPVTRESHELNVNREKCPGFDILEDVPDDHPFKLDYPSRRSADWLARIRKEHKILQSSLPGNIHPPPF